MNIYMYTMDKGRFTAAIKREDIDEKLFDAAMAPEDLSGMQLAQLSAAVLREIKTGDMDSIKNRHIACMGYGDTNTQTFFLAAAAKDSAPVTIQDLINRKDFCKSEEEYRALMLQVELMAEAQYPDSGENVHAAEKFCFRQPDENIYGERKQIRVASTADRMALIKILNAYGSHDFLNFYHDDRYYVCFQSPDDTALYDSVMTDLAVNGFKFEDAMEWIRLEKEKKGISKTLLDYIRKDS